jgi:hypothetical protein
LISGKEGPEFENNLINTSSINDKNKYHPSYAKKPFNKTDVIPAVVSGWLNLQHLLILEQYCEAAGILFVYGSWDTQTNTLINSINKIDTLKNNPLSYKNFIDFSHIDKELLDCHEQERTKHQSVFDLGSDKLHFGVHTHLHIAEKFISEINKIGTINV